MLFQTYILFLLWNITLVFSIHSDHMCQATERVKITIKEVRLSNLLLSNVWTIHSFELTLSPESVDLVQNSDRPLQLIMTLISVCSSCSL